MTINIDGSTVSDITVDGNAVTEVTVDGSVVWTASGGTGDFHLNMRDANDYVDYSSHGLTLSPGQSILMWVKVHQVGSSSSAHYPGLFSNSSGGDWDNFFEIYHDGGANAVTSGTPSVRLSGEASAGGYMETFDFTMDLDNNPWQLLGFTYHSDQSITFWRNDGASSTNANNITSGEVFNFNYLGYSYAGQNDGGSGGKDMDTVGIWDRELTSTEVADWYNSGIVPDTPQNIWHFNDDSDTSTAVDSAGTADGTISGPTYQSGNAF